MKLTALALLAALVAGCGNYSNEDLEFMNALPGDDLGVSTPKTSAIGSADAAELARFTFGVTISLNGLLTGMVNLVDAVRSQPPTSRGPNSRTWGPAPSDDHPGWQVRMVIMRDGADPAQFDYDIAFHRVGAGDTDWPVLLSGWFRSGQTVRRGRGQFTITTAAVRAEGFEPGFDFLDRLLVDYDTDRDPVTIEMNIANLPNPAKPNDISQAHYLYAAALDGRRQMTFDFQGDIVPTLSIPPVLESTRVTSQWLDTGQGKGSLTILSGDGANAMESQCWNRLLLADYSHKDWDPLSDHGSLTDDCPDIALLDVPAL